MPKPSFPKGKSGNPKGRPKGSKSHPERRAVMQIMTDMGCEPFEILGMIAMDQVPNKPASLRLQMEAAAELAQYIAPKLKSIEHKETGAPFQYIIYEPPKNAN